MKYLQLLFLLGCGFGLFAQTDVRLTVDAPGCGKPLNVYAFNGAGFDLVQAFAAGEKSGTFTTTLRTEEPTFLYVGTAPQDVRPLIVGGEAALTVTGKCGRMRQARITGSDLNTAYADLKREFNDLNNRFGAAVRGLAQATRKQDEAAAAAHRATLAEVDGLRREMVTRARATDPVLGRVAAMNALQSYQHQEAGQYANEVEYFAANYFAAVDRADAGYDRLPWTYEGHRQYAATLAQAVRGEELRDLLMQEYERWPGGSRAQFFAMSGGFSALARAKHPAAVPLAETIVERFEQMYPEQVRPVAKQALALQSFAAGAEAPLFTGKSPDGEDIALESLRGKVVLIDFWASWCGPCRKENPNVVKVYNQYKDRGFEILGVSLDKTRDRWVKAIEADNLTWLHVSDLKGWSSAYSRLYGVSSIPHTVLVGPDGKILARNLRGKALEAKLREVFSTK